MTATRNDGPKPPPRILVRTVWVLHRALIRFSGGRVGLWRPAAGERFGMMRLHTVGRRSGRPRVAIVGYYEDGANLVTLAMNGWGEQEPAWWLNLQARPTATVELADGAREVRPRTATPDERARLWSRFDDFPGWGDDLDGLAARRPGETAVVILERNPAAVAAADPIPSRTAGISEPRRRLRRRHLWFIPGLAISLFASVQSAHFGVGLTPLLLFGIVPHLTVIAGVGQPHAPGQLPARAVPLFNAMHHPAAPLAMLAVGAAGLLSPFWFVGALAWLSHVVVDRALGDGVRGADGFVRGHAVPVAA